MPRRPIVDAPTSVEGLAIGRDHVVFLADGAAGVAPRDGEGRAAWIATDVAAPRAVHTHRLGNTVVLIGLTPSLERWTFSLDERTVGREVLERNGWNFAHTSGPATRGTHRIIWTAGHGTIGRHDVVDAQSEYLGLAPHEPGDFAIVPDAAHPEIPEAGWIVGFVHDPSGDEADLRVIDAADLRQPALATVRIPRPANRGLRCAWLPSTRH